MIDEKEVKRISKFLSLVLRHQPSLIGITLDENGWTDVSELLQKTLAFGFYIDKSLLNYIVENNPKKRFAFNATLDKIRASQGHSLKIELGYENQEPPEILFHGTSINSVESILNQGLLKRNRQHVHLSKDTETATKVGQRHGKPYIFEVLAKKMFSEGYKFYLSANGVWLTDHVPVEYLIIKE